MQNSEEIAAVSDLNILDPNDTQRTFLCFLINSLSSLLKPPSGPIITDHFKYLFKFDFITS